MIFTKKRDDVSIKGSKNYIDNLLLLDLPLTHYRYIFKNYTKQAGKVKHFTRR